MTHQDGFVQIWDAATRHCQSFKNDGSPEAINKNNQILYVTKVKALPSQTAGTVNVSIRDPADNIIHELVNVCPADKPELSVAFSQDGSSILLNCYYINFVKSDQQAVGSSNVLYWVKFKPKF